MNLAPLLYIIRVPKRHLLFLIGGLFVAISAVFEISPIGLIDLLIVLLLLWGPLAAGLKESSSGLESLNAYISDCEQIDHYFWLLYGYLLHSLDITDPVTEALMILMS
jgi:hypothetical protein